MDNLDNNIPTDTLPAEEIPPVPPQDDLQTAMPNCRKNMKICSGRICWKE